MTTMQKVTFTFYTDPANGVDIGQLTTAKKIRMAALAAGENMAQWARELGTSRQYVYQVVSGKRHNQKVRDFIQRRLNTIFWPDPPAQELKKDA